MKKKMILIVILAILTMSCLSTPKENTIIPLVIPVEKAVLSTIKIVEYEDGVFIVWDEWNKTELNYLKLQREIDLLRLELSKFDP